MNKSNKIFTKAYRFFAFCIIIPSLITSFFSIINSILTIKKLTDNTHQTAVQTMSSAYNYCNNNLDLLNNTAKLFSSIPSVNKCLTAKSLSYSEDVTQNLVSLSVSNPYIINAFIADTKQKLILHDSGISSFEEYFTQNTVYKNYSHNYWSDEFIFYNSKPYRILSPSKATINGKSESVIPIAYKISSPSGILVFNVDLSTLISINRINSYSSTQYYMINKHTKELFPLNNAYLESVNDDTFRKILLDNPNTNFKYKLPNEKVLVTTSSENNSMLGFTLAAVTPLREIYNSVVRYSLILITMNIIILAVISILSLKNTNKIFNPIKNIYLTLAENSNNTDNNILSEMESLAKKIRLENTQLTKILPYAQEKYLINILNNLEIYNENTQSDNILKDSLDFKYDNFSVILLQLSPSINFFDKFNTQDYNLIKKGFYNIICEMFSENFDSYVLPSQDNILNIILNYNDNNAIENIREILKTITSYLKYDLEYVTLSIGLSSTHNGLTGLKHAYKEALNNFITYSTPSEIPLVDISAQVNVLYSSTEEVNIYSALSSFNKDRIMASVNDLFIKNDNLSTREKKTLYNYILNTILKFLRNNKIPYMDELLDFEITNKFLSQPLSQIEIYIDELIDYITASKKSNSIFDEIYSYIKANCYSYDLSLKQLAGIFALSQPTLTRMIQTNTGMPFKQLVNNLRIEKAKDLLKTSNITIDEIYELVGFSNKQTFFRVFKSITGVTPGDYKKQN